MLVKSKLGHGWIDTPNKKHSDISFITHLSLNLVNKLGPSNGTGPRTIVIQGAPPYVWRLLKDD